MEENKNKKAMFRKENKLLLMCFFKKILKGKLFYIEIIILTLNKKGNIANMEINL